MLSKTGGGGGGGGGQHITPIKLGVKFEPATIVLIYRDESALRMRRIPARNVDILTDVAAYALRFKSDAKYKRHFAKISNRKLEKLVFVLQDHMKGYTLAESVQRAKQKYDQHHHHHQHQQQQQHNQQHDESNADLDESSAAAINDIILGSIKPAHLSAKKKANNEEREGHEEDEDEDEDEDDDDDDDDDADVKKMEKKLEKLIGKSEIDNDFKDTDTEANDSDEEAAAKEKEKMNKKKSDALALLSNQMRSLKSAIYEEEDDNDDEEEDQGEEEDEQEEEDIEEQLPTERDDEDESESQSERRGLPMMKTTKPQLSTKTTKKKSNNKKSSSNEDERIETADAGADSDSSFWTNLCVLELLANVNFEKRNKNIYNKKSKMTYVHEP